MSTELPWGLTRRELDDAADFAARIARSRLLSFDERTAEALSGIGMAVAASLLPPARRDLVDAGLLAIDAAVQERMQAHGMHGSGRRYAVYWGAGNRLHGAATDAVDERIALLQLWAALGEQDQETLALLAEYGDLEAAARAAGVSYRTWQSRLHRARGRASAAWFDHEPAPGYYSRSAGRSAGPGWTLAQAIRSRVAARRYRRKAA